ncbi:MAG: hypothetical protein WCX82_04620 [archaeon]|jgi:hypothetical protein
MAAVKTNVNRTLKHQIGDSVFHASPSRELGYSTHGKQVIRENPGLLKAVYDFSNNKGIYHADSKGRFKIIHRYPKNGANTDRNYIVEIQNRKYFIKESNDENPDRDYSYKIKHNGGRDGVSEHKAIEILRQHGVDVISAHFSYSDPILKKSFIAYDFSPLSSLLDLYVSGKIKKSEYEFLKKEIQEKLNATEEEIKQKFSTLGIDNYTQVWDLKLENIFYDLKNRRFLVFDPILLREKR